MQSARTVAEILSSIFPPMCSGRNSLSRENATHKRGKVHVICCLCLEMLFYFVWFQTWELRLGIDSVCNPLPPFRPHPKNSKLGGTPCHDHRHGSIWPQLPRHRRSGPLLARHLGFVCNMFNTWLVDGLTVVKIQCVVCLVVLYCC